MRVLRLVVPMLAGGLAASSLLAQVPRRVQGQVAQSAPRLLVANPYSFLEADSASAILIGQGMRDRIEKVVGTSYQVVTRDIMNEALVAYGYPTDAMLPVADQRTLASSMTAKGVVTATLTRVPGGALLVTARFTGINDDAGNVVAVAQKPSQPPATLGDDVGQALAGAIRSYDDAKSCIDLWRANPQKATGAANKAIQTLPNHGLAHYCQAVMLLEKKTHADSLEAAKHLQAAAQGDPLSLRIWNELRVRYQLQGDIAKTVDAYKQMLLISPTNQPLREEAFKFFVATNQADAAQAAAEEGLRLDPTNADLYDLLSKACLLKENYRCAIDALERQVAVDSTKADTAFYNKITLFAAQGPDTVRLLKWSGRARQKYPENLAFERRLLYGYVLSGMTDSSVALTQDLMIKDPAGTVDNALAAAKTLQEQKRIEQAMPILEFVSQKGDAQAKEGAATILLNGALPFLQPPQDFDRAATMLRQVTTWADPKGKVFQIANYYLGLSILQQIAKIDPEAEKQKSCDLATKEQSMAAEADRAFKASGAYKPDDVAKFQKYLDGLRPRTASMLKAYCK